MNVIQCDQCETQLGLDWRGGDEYGESASWFRLEFRDDQRGKGWDLCSQACVAAFAESDGLRLEHDARAEVVAEVVQTIRDDEAGEGE